MLPHELQLDAFAILVRASRFEIVTQREWLGVADPGEVLVSRDPVEVRVSRVAAPPVTGDAAADFRFLRVA
jgi:hypothetical protein